MITRVKYNTVLPVEYFRNLGNMRWLLLYKSKDNFELTNFRPISVLPVLSKVLERIAHDQLVSHLLKFNLSDRQSGFHPQHSTQDVLVHVADCWRKAIDESKFTDAAFLDMSKAFDCVNHDILLSKLACYRGCWMILLCGLLVICHVVGSRYALRDRFLPGV